MKRLANSGVNILVIVISVAVFIGAFLLLTSIGGSQTPPSITILVAAHDLDIGQMITPKDFTQRVVYEDENAPIYVLAEDADTIVGGVMALPVFAGQPIFKTSVFADAGTAYRLSAVLAEYPDYSLYPLILEDNVVAPDISMFLPGDVINITVVMDDRPETPTTPTPQAISAYAIVPTPAPVLPATPSAEEAESAPLDRAYPPLAKDLFPGGVLVVAVQGAPEQTVQSTAEPGSGSSEDAQPILSDFNQTKMLILLIPNAAREILSLAWQQGDLLVVSLLARGQDGVTPGFTYWDFEELFKVDRAEYLGIATPMPVSSSDGSALIRPVQPVSTPDASLLPSAPITSSQTITP